MIKYIVGHYYYKTRKVSSQFCQTEGLLHDMSIEYFA